MWSGLGVNYGNVGANNIVTTGDGAYLLSVGMKRIRMYIPDYTGDLAAFRAKEKLAKTLGFEYVIYGISSSAVTSANWATYHDAVVAEAIACEADGAVCDEFQIGNELELKNDGSITDAEVRANVRTLATDVKAVFSGVVSYSTESGTTAQGHGSDLWCTEGKGDLDTIGVNVYADSVAPYTGTSHSNYTTYIPNLVKTFGSNFYLSEFGLEGVSADFTAIPEHYKLSEMRKMYAYIRNQGISSAYAFLWNEDSNEFAIKLQSGVITDMWNPLLNDGGRNTFKN